MAIWNLGSINLDIVYSVPHLPSPGETLASIGRETFLGGKGANMSVAAARAAARVHHIGAVGQDGFWAADRLLEYGVDTRSITKLEVETAQAIILVDQDGENSIILHPGANHQIPTELVEGALSQASTSDWFVCQNETNQQGFGAELAKKLGLKVAYAAAPFDVNAVESVLPFLDFLILNEIEMAQLADAKAVKPDELGVDFVIVTKGARGSTIYAKSEIYDVAAVDVVPVDTTGAGDTFTGYVLAGLDRGMPLKQAVNQATLAAALMVTRHGTADVIPDLSEVQAFRS